MIYMCVYYERHYINAITLCATGVYAMSNIGYCCVDEEDIETCSSVPLTSEIMRELKYVRKVKYAIISLCIYRVYT